MRAAGPGVHLETKGGAFLESIRQYLKRTDKLYLLLCIFSSTMAVVALASWAAKQGSGFATDELTGLIGAVALMRPSKSVSDLEVKSVKKKYKDKKFAAGCSRDVINTGAERLGWTIEELMEKTILAMRSCEESVNKEMETLA